MNNALPSERMALAATIDPDAYAQGTTQTSDWVDMADFEAIMASLYVGTLGTDHTIDAKLEQATDSSGSGAKDISGKAITQLDTSSPSDSDNQVVINCRGDELDISGGFRYVRLSVTITDSTSPAGGNSDVGGSVYGFGGHQPGTDNDLGSVVEVVS